MPPKRIQVQPASRASSKPQGYLSTIYTELTAPENQTVVRSIALFGVAVAFFSSSWSEILLPPI